MSLFCRGDYHIHTTYSDGNSSIQEIVEAAVEKGLKEIAVTDHGPRNIGSGVKNPQQFLEIKKEVQKTAQKYTSIEIFTGAEANIIDISGNIDIPQKVYDELDFLLIGLHPYVVSSDIKNFWNIVIQNFFYYYKGFFEKQVVSINTEALKNAVKKHQPFAVTHPGLKMPVDIAEIAKVCALEGTLFEINTGHKFQTLQDVKKAFSQGVYFVVNSDSHFKDTVGNLSAGFQLLDEAGVPADRIVNKFS